MKATARYFRKLSLVIFYERDRGDNRDNRATRRLVTRGTVMKCPREKPAITGNSVRQVFPTYIMTTTSLASRADGVSINIS